MTSSRQVKCQNDTCQVRERVLAGETETFGELPPIFGENREPVLGNRSIILGRLETVPMWESALVTPGERLVKTQTLVDHHMMERFSHNIERQQMTTVTTAAGAASNNLMLNSAVGSYQNPPSIAAITAASVLPTNQQVPAGTVSLFPEFFQNFPEFYKESNQNFSKIFPIDSLKFCSLKKLAVTNIQILNREWLPETCTTTYPQVPARCTHQLSP